MTTCNSIYFKEVSRMLTILALFLFFAFCSRPAEISLQDYGNIQEGFISPADTNKPWCYYYWIGDDISKEGLTKDMEAMKEFGLGAAFIGNINPDEVDGPVPLFSDQWWDIMVHSVVEGHRLGIDIGHFNCPGWSQSGGPWVTYDKAMRHLVFSETTLMGPGKIRTGLEKPADEFQDTYVLAFKKIDAEKNKLSLKNAKVSCRPAIEGTENWLDGDNRTSALFPIKKDARYAIEINAAETLNARSITIVPAHPEITCNVELQARVDGHYKSIKTFVVDRGNLSVNVGPAIYGPAAISLPETRASDFRLICTNLDSEKPRAGFAEIRISESPVLDNYIEKTLGKMHPTPFPAFDSYLWVSQPGISDTGLLVTDVIVLNDQMNEQGVLTWDVPDGEWTVLRMGMTPTGTQNAPAAPQGKGYEIDKASAELAQFHFDRYMLEIIKRIPEASLPALKYVIADSYEMGSQNWTDGFAGRFEANYGYDPVKYLPVFSGRVVGSVEESDRFLWDLRRLVADDVAYEYVGGLKKASNAYGLKTWLENYGHWGYPGEFLMYGGQSDLIGGEFWNEGTLGDIECKSASSAAHIYGKPITSAEAFTAAALSYTRHPALLKKRGDWSFTEGINHFVLHLYIHQPREEKPGVNAWFSTEFNRHNTWFEQGKAWVDYIRRCQHMLQQGKYVADVLYFIGEDAPKMTGTRDPELPGGYSYDYINAEVIQKRLSVKDGKFVLPDGMSYSIMAIPGNANMRPEVLAKIEKLVQLGGTILGPKPGKSPSLRNYPDCDMEIKEIADRMWGTVSQGDRLQSQCGKGFVLDGMGLQEALDFIGVDGDMLVRDDAPVLWTHRGLPGMEIYFITNQGDEVVSIEPSFRVESLRPQLWDAVTGEIRKLNDFSVTGDRTIVPLKLEPAQSYFLVFTNRSNENTGEGYERNNPRPGELLTLSGDWTLDFRNKEFGPEETIRLDDLADWTLSDDEGIRYYSGTATYRTSFELDQIPEGGEVYLNLGKVGMLARADLNGTDLGVAWMSPYRLHAAGALKEGKNELEVEVVNVWRNRMVGDLDLPADQRHTIYTTTDAVAGEKLKPSGLMGPVRIEHIK